MDSYEKMAKMNKLAKDLKQHGFAESSFEAIQQANQIYGDDDLSHDVKHGMITSPHDRMTGEEKMNETEIDRKFIKMQNDMKTLTDKMNEIIKAINDMDSRITQLSKRPVERVIERPVEKPVEKSAETHTEESPVQQTHHEEKKTEEFTNQRVGNYQSQDVAIDKMFYFGKK
ncbi:MAG: hypothetical protein ACP5NV_04575 [Candidatus Woesearchaeota archaeon]